MKLPLERGYKDVRYFFLKYLDRILLFLPFMILVGYPGVYTEFNSHGAISDY